MNIQELRDKRARLITEARSVMESATNGMTAEDETRFDALMAEGDSIAKRIARMESLESAENGMTGTRGRIVPPSTASRPNDGLRNWLLGNGDREMGFSLRNDPLSSVAEFRSWQSRAQSVGTATAGGYVVAPDFAGEVERAMLAFGGVRSAARVIRTATGADLPWPLTDDTANKAVIVAENVVFPAGADVAFGSKSLKSFKYTTGEPIKVSKELIQDAAINVEELIGSMLGERIARGTNEHFTTGTGSGQPEGAVTAAFLGVTCASATLIEADEVLDLVHSVGSAYRANARFMLNDTTLKLLRKLKGSDGQPIWGAGINGKEPQTIAGFEYVVNDAMASPAAAARTILFGDFSKMIVRDVLDVELIRLNERYAEFGQVAFTAISRHDSRLLDAGQHPIKYLRQL